MSREVNKSVVSGIWGLLGTDKKCPIKIGSSKISWFINKVLLRHIYPDKTKTTTAEKIFLNSTISDLIAMSGIFCGNYDSDDEDE